MPENITNEELLKQNIRLKKISNITKAINSTLDIGKLLNTIMEAIKEILETEASSLLFYDDKTDELVFKVALGGAGDELVEKYRISSGKGIAGWVAQEQKTIIINDAYSDDRFNPEFDKITGFKTNAIIAAPLLFKGKIIGVIEGINPVNRKIFDQEDMELFNLFADQAVMAVQNAVIFEQAVYSKRIETEIKKAREFQSNFIQKFDRTIHSLDIDGRNLISNELGGEFFQIFELHDCCSFVVSDIHKKGIPGAISSSAILGAVNSLIMIFAKKPMKILKNIGKLVKKYIGVFKDLSFFYGVYKPESMEFEFVNTGFAYPILLRNGKSRYLNFNRQSFSEKNIEAEKYPPKIRLKLQSGDIFTIITDGIVNLKNNDFRQFGLKKVMQIIENSDDNPHSISQNIETEINNFIKDNSLREDITMLVFKVS